MVARSVSALILVLGLILTFPDAASSDPYGNPNPGYTPDDYDQWYCFDPSVQYSNRSYIDGAMANLDAQVPNVYDVYTSNCGTSTDVVWIEQSNGILGQAVCWRWRDQANQICDNFFVIYDTAPHFQLTSYCGGDANQYIANLVITFRHELGHTRGLSHVLPYGSNCGPPSPYASDAMVCRIGL